VTGTGRGYRKASHSTRGPSLRRGRKLPALGRLKGGGALWGDPRLDMTIAFYDSQVPILDPCPPKPRGRPWKDRALKPGVSQANNDQSQPGNHHSQPGSNHSQPGNHCSQPGSNHSQPGNSWHAPADVAVASSDVSPIRGGEIPSGSPGCATPGLCRRRGGLHV